MRLRCLRELGRGYLKLGGGPKKEFKPRGTSWGTGKTDAYCWFRNSEGLDTWWVLKAALWCSQDQEEGCPPYGVSLHNTFILFMPLSLYANLCMPYVSILG